MDDIGTEPESAIWSAAGELDYWVRERGEWWGRARGRMVITSGSKLLIFARRRRTTDHAIIGSDSSSSSYWSSTSAGPNRFAASRAYDLFSYASPDSQQQTGQPSSEQNAIKFTVGAKRRGVYGFTWRIGTSRTSFDIRPSTPGLDIKLSLMNPILVMTSQASNLRVVVGLVCTVQGTLLDRDPDRLRETRLRPSWRHGRST